MRMDSRLHDALDDEREAAALTPAQLAELEDARALFDGVVRAIPSRPLPPLGASVLRRIGETEAGAGTRAAGPAPLVRRGLAAWLWSPQRVSMSVRPAYALAAAALLVVAVGLGGLRTGDAGTAPVTAAAPAAEILVQFRLDAPQAQSVTLAGDFSNWSPAHAMKRSEDGVWTIVVPLSPGVHEYAFVVDGQRWVPDPAAPSKPDGFGGVNSRVAVLGPDARS